MFKKTVIAAGLGLALSSAAQAEYQFELGANSSTGDFEVGSMNNADQERFGLAGTYYIESVDTSKGPLGEAAFLDRASSINLDLSTGEIDGDGDNIDIDSYAAGSRLVSKESGWLVDLGYRLDEIENEQSDTFSIGAGKYVLENTAVVLNYINAEADTLGEYAYANTLGESDTYGLGVEHLWHLEQGAVKLDTSLALVDPEMGDDINAWGLGGTYYVNHALGFGAAYSQSDSDEIELEKWSLFAQWFVTEQVALSLAYSEQEDQQFDLNSDAIQFNADVRF